MRICNYEGLAFFLFAVLNVVNSALGTEIKSIDRFKSPDNSFTAEYAGGKEAIIIKDNKTGKAYPNIPTISPVFSIKWTGDSKAIVKVSHIANGSGAGVFYFKSGEWVPCNTAPKIGNGYEVVEQVLKEHSVELTYKVFERPQGDVGPKYYLYSFEFQPATGKRINEKTKKIDGETYKSLVLTTK